MIELPEAAINAISAVESIEDYDTQMTKFELSPAPLEVREEAMRQLRASKPQFDTSDKSPSAELDRQMKDGLADTSDMNGFG